MKITSDNFKQGDFIPEALAWGRIGEDGSTVRSTNLNPQLSWTDAPEGTASFVLACLDDDVPTDLAERDASGEIPVSQPRRRFVHWVQPNCPADVTSIAEGALAEERKTTPGFGAVCINDYSRGGTPAPGETGTGYDGPCPPFFDARWHYYHFLPLSYHSTLSCFVSCHFYFTIKCFPVSPISRTVYVPTPSITMFVTFVFPVSVSKAADFL